MIHPALIALLLCAEHLWSGGTCGMLASFSETDRMMCLRHEATALDVWLIE